MFLADLFNSLRPTAGGRRPGST